MALFPPSSKIFFPVKFKVKIIIRQISLQP